MRVASFKRAEPALAADDDRHPGPSGVMHAGLSRKVLAGASVAAAATTAQSIRARAARRLISWAPGSGTPHDGALHARTIGHGASGVLLLHGLGSSNAYWGATYDTLGDTGCLVVPDLLGFGASPRPPVGYTPDDHVRALGAVLDELGVAGPLVVGAHSLGCLVALALADRHPGLVASIVAFCPPLYPDEAAARKRIARLGWLERQVATDGAWAETVCRWMCEHRRAAASIAGILRPGLPGAIRRDGVQHSWASYSQTFTHVLAAAEGAQWLAHVHVPVELVAGSEDRVTDLGYLRRLADDLPHVTLTVRDRAAVLPPWPPSDPPTAMIGRSPRSPGRPKPTSPRHLEAEGRRCGVRAGRRGEPTPPIPPTLQVSPSTRPFPVTPRPRVSQRPSLLHATSTPNPHTGKPRVHPHGELLSASMEITCPPTRNSCCP